MKPQGSWPGSVEAAVEMVEDMGFKMGSECCAIQNYKDYLCFYGPGDHMKGTGMETWKFEKPDKYHGAYFSLTPKVGVGDHLPGSPMKPQGSWPGSIEDA